MATSFQRDLLLMVCATALSGCAGAATTRFNQCQVDATPSVEAAHPSERVTLTGGPYTTAFDTIVRVGGALGTEISVDRTDCDSCDTCRDDEACASCGDECLVCDLVCDACVETLSFTVPNVAPGATTLVVVNGAGSSLPVPFTVLGASDTGVSDTGASDTGDTGDTSPVSDTADTATGTDTAAPDTGSSDTSGVDTSASDTSTPDTGVSADTATDTASTTDTALETAFAADTASTL